MAKIININSFSLKTPVEIDGQQFELSGLAHVRSLELQGFFKEKSSFMAIRAKYAELLETCGLPADAIAKCDNGMLDALMLIAQGFDPEIMTAGEQKAENSETDSGQ